MNPEVKKLWVDALRSGKYKQGQNALATYDLDTEGYAYCCLGVLCEVAREQGVDVEVLEFGTEDDELYLMYHRQHEILPSHIADWAGLDDQRANFTAIYGSMIIQTSLVERNDAGRTFDGLAEDIETYF